MTVFLRGAGGFSKSSQPYSYTNYSSDKVSAVKIPKSQPFTVFEDCTQPSQACIFDFIIA
jgi:peroxisomal enoyl-CoA hydratase 2